MSYATDDRDTVPTANHITIHALSIILTQLNSVYTIQPVVKPV